jgi:hypothetical protein
MPIFGKKSEEKELKGEIAKEEKKTKELKKVLEEPEDKESDIAAQLRLERLRLRLARVRLERLQAEHDVRDEIKKATEERTKVESQISEKQTEATTSE